MSTKSQLFFLDLGLSNMQHGVSQGRIMTCDGDGKGLKAILEGVGNQPDGLGITEDHMIVIPPGATFTPKQLHLVPKHGKVYWCDREGMRVFRANLDGSDIEVLVTTGTSDADRLDQRNWCVGIAVDHVRRFMYWTQKGPSKGNKGRLFRAGLDMPRGEDSTARSDIKLLLDHLPEPIDLDLDSEENALYLTDRGDPPFGNTVSKISLEQDVVQKTILIRKLHEAIGLALDVKNRMMYFADLNGSLYKSKMDGSDEVTLLSEIGDLTGVACLSVA
ncbi:hypothetical protein B0A55_04300 [Friedmanniomyces simplex]|uniref:Uncharacterized protein n=1 Tax=Friedmanniomyces simplex TaxID=329884 RepID=A0A4V5NFN6_9PEZI|nr:hypothetical protein B0A55_04300 [Friedmanniomyces simplex]